MASQRKDVVPGTLDLLVLRIIAAQLMHGWASGEWGKVLDGA